jgi:O-acetyl-ADP-ribose deacetylase (regulator of RNase III)
LHRADQENHKLLRILRKRFLTSIVFPMLGAGDGGLSIESVAESLIPAAINYLRYTPNPTLKEIYFLAFKARDRSACERVLEAFCAKGALTRLGSR